MKILHICVTGPYTDGFNYQENMLTKYQAKAGHDVYVIASEWEWGKNGKVQSHIGDSEYLNADGVSIIRLPIKKNKDVFYRYKRFIGMYEAIEKVKPEIIFVHNLQFFDISKIVKYAKKHSVKIYADNHADFSNSARSKAAVLFYKIVWRHMAQMIEPYTTKFYGVLPARVDFLKSIYGLPEEKCELLVMGADDEEVERASAPENQLTVRNKLGISKDDFLIVTGGKIDEWKTQTLLLMEAVHNIDRNDIKLLIFGPVSDAIKDRFNKAFDKNKMNYICWANTQQSYDYFAIADLVVFPGRHSVYWEQAAGQGKPMLCKYWEGTTHVDIGGNVEFLKGNSSIEIKKHILALIENTEKFEMMKKEAEKQQHEKFLYKNISLISIEQEGNECFSWK